MRRSAFKYRLIFVGIVFTVCFIGMMVRFYYVQVVRHDELYAKAKVEYTDVIKKKGKRGEIYDVNSFLLVGNIPCVTVIADPSIAGDDEKCRLTAELIAPILGVNQEDIFKKLTNKYLSDGRARRYAMLKRKIPLEDAEKLQKVIKGNKCTGIYLKNTTKRFYPQGSLLAQTLGFINIDRDKEIPVSGIERATNDYVAGGEGKIIRERDRKGYTLSYGDNEIDETVNGKNIFLTIDAQIQMIVEDELDKLCEKFSPRAAYAIMVNPNNGNILAMAQRPTFDPNDRSTMTPDAWRNRMTTDVFEPGSTMKPIVIASALDNHIVTPETEFDCERGYWAEMRLRDSHRMGVDSVSRILAESSNIGTAKIAIKMGKNLLYKSLRRFGIGKPTGIPLRPEATSYLRKPDRWDYLSISRFPIGQGVAVSPMQLVRAYCALANGGYLVHLRLIDRVQDTMTGKVEKKKIITPDKVFMREKTQKEIVEIMKLVTQEGGTAKRAALEHYDVAGKTGTSQKWIPTDKEKHIRGHYSESKFFATFVGFVPADKPAFVLAVITDEPKGSHYGGVVSAPTFREISRRTLAYLNIPPTK